MDGRPTDRADQRFALQVFAQALGKEAHNLTRWPDLLWQQLYNRLQWVDGPVGAVGRVLAPELSERSKPDAVLWLHTRTHLRESEALLATLVGAGSAMAVAWSPDGTRIAAGSRSETLRIWDAASGAQPFTLASAGHPPAAHAEGIRAFDPGEYRDDLANGDVWALAWSPDGTRIVTGSHVQSSVSGALGGALRMWDAITGAELATLTRPGQGPVRAVAWSPDGTRIAAGCGEETVRIWDAADGSELLTLAGGKGTAWALAWSPDGSRIVAGSNAWGTAVSGAAGLVGTLTIWDPVTGSEVASFGRPGQGPVRAVAWSPDGTRIAGSGEETVQVWDAADGAELLTLTGHTGPVWAVAHSPDGTRIATGAADGTLKIWDATAGTELATLTGHHGRVRAVSWRPDGTRIVSGSDEDQTLRIWDAAAGGEPPTRGGHTKIVDAVAWSPDGSRVVSGSDDTTLKIWDTTTGTELATLTGHADEVWAVAWSPDGTRIVSGSKDKSLRIWDAADGTELAVLTGHIDGVAAVACSPDGTRIVSSCLDGRLKIWNAAGGTELATLEEPGQVQVLAVAYSPDGTRIAADASRRTHGTGDPPDLRIWDAVTGSQLATYRGPTTGDVRALAYSPDGTRITSAGAANSFGDNGEVTVREAVTGRVLLTVIGHTRPVTTVTFSPDGTRIVTGSFDGTVKVWDALTMRCLAILPLGAAVHCCRHSPTGSHLCCGDSSGTVHLLELIGSAEPTRDQLPVRRPHSDETAGNTGSGIDNGAPARSVAEPQQPGELPPHSPEARPDDSPRPAAPAPKKPWYKRRRAKPS
jgi:WD40 repeat protein